MNAPWLMVLAPLFSLAINVIAQIIVAHLVSRILPAILSGFVCGFVANLSLMGSLFAVSRMNFLEDMCISLLTYLALSFCFFAFLNLNTTSVRVRIVRELLRQKEGGLSTDTLMSRYSPQEFMKRRMKRLEESGQIIMRDGKWVLRSRRLLVFVVVSSALRRLIIP